MAFRFRAPEAEFDNQVGIAISKCIYGYQVGLNPSLNHIIGDELILTNASNLAGYALMSDAFTKP